MLGKPPILSLFPNTFINSIKHVYSDHVRYSMYAISKQSCFSAAKKNFFPAKVSSVNFKRRQLSSTFNCTEILAWVTNSFATHNHDDALLVRAL